jgi:archaellum biogenesis ATPase FlaH
LAHKEACGKCRSQGLDSAGDNFTNYGEGLGGYCFSCGFSVLSDARKEELGIGKYEYDDKEVMTKELITEDEIEKIKSYTGTAGKGQRGVPDETYKAYACRFKYSEETAEVEEAFYPYTQDYKAAGFKVRKTPVKDFYSVGKIGKQSELFGQWKWKDNHSKYVLLCAGELDAMSAYTMLENYRKGKGSDFEPTPCVSSAIGESGSFKQVQLQYNWLNQFERIVVCYDNDTAGKEAVEKLVDVLPKGKMFVMNLSLKDANEYLTKDKEKMFLRAFFDAPAYSPSGIVASSTIYEEIVGRSKQPKLPFPPMLKKLNKMLAGGINYGYIVNILAGSGSGKSSLVNQCTAYWMLECDEKVLVASLEAEAAEFGENLLSYQMGKKISMMQDQQEKIDFVASTEAEETARNLFTRPDGTPRIYLLDDRGDYSKLQTKIEEVVISCGVRIVIIDVISDVFSGMSIEQIDLWMAWEKKLVKQYNCILIQVAHTRKGGSSEKSASQGKALTEESIIGSGTQYRSAGINIALQRDKTAEDDIVRNTTVVHLLKSRATGVTGIACELFYDGQTHTLWDKEDYMEANPTTF